MSFCKWPSLICKNDVALRKAGVLACRLDNGHPLLFIVLRIYNFDLIFHLTSIWRWVLSGPEALNNLTTVVEFNNHPQKKEKIGLECLYFFYLIQGKSNKKVIGLQLIIDFNFTTLFSWVGSRHMVQITTFTENWKSKRHLLEVLFLKKYD